MLLLVVFPFLLALEFLALLHNTISIFYLKKSITYGKLISVGIKAQNYILGHGPWPRTLVGPKTNKQ